jgi:hypothetical protein
MTSSLRNSPPGAAAKSGLTISKVVAGAGAAATTAVVGSVFGADGTVVGAAVGSVVSAVAAAAYERSYDQTRSLVVARVRPRGAQDPEATQVLTTEVLDAEVTQVIPAQRLAGDTGSTGSVAPQPPARRRRWPLFAGAAVVIFAVGLLFVTGIEFFTGGPVLSSNKQGGTSVGTLLRPGAQSAAPTTEAAPASAESSAEPTASASASSTKRSAAKPSGRSAADGDAAPSATAAPRGRAASPTTTPAGLPGLPQAGN